MESVVRDDILAILGRVCEILRVREEQDVHEIKELSNHTLHDASIFQTIDTVEIAVVTYALYKLLDREQVDDNTYAVLFKNFECALASLKKGKFGAYNSCIKELFNVIENVDVKVKTYFQEVVEKARINKSSKLFEHGLTVKRAADIMGISEWDLLKYLGATNFIDRFKPGGLSAKKRLNVALRLFG